MSRTPLCLFLAFLLLAPALAAPAAAKEHKPGSTAPGKYTDWGGEIDELEVVETFKMSDYPKVAVEPFDTKDTPLPDQKDNTWEPVHLVLGDPAAPFTEGLSQDLGAKTKVAQSAGGEGQEGQALLVRAKVTIMDPGSKAARYWASFGAGAARTELQGEVVDAASGKVLLRFKQARRSGFGIMGGDYVKLMNRNLRTIGNDVASILRAF